MGGKWRSRENKNFDVLGFVGNEKFELLLSQTSTSSQSKKFSYVKIDILLVGGGGGGVGGGGGRFLQFGCGYC